MFFVADHAFFGDVFLFLRFQPGGEGADVADVFVDGILGFFLCINVILMRTIGMGELEEIGRRSGRASS